MPEEEPQPLRPVPRCARCGDVVGVYEPAVLVVDDGTIRDTSIAAERTSNAAAGAWHHRDCFFSVAEALA